MDSVPRTRVRPSAAGQLHEFLRVPFAPHLECSGDGVYFLEVLGAELEGKRSQVLFEPFPVFSCPGSERSTVSAPAAKRARSAPGWPSFARRCRTGDRPARGWLCARLRRT